MATKYEQQTYDEPVMANEPVAAYGAAVKRYACPTLSGEPTVAEDIPSEYIRMALECAINDEKNGRLVPNSKVIDALHKRLEWK